MIPLNQLIPECLLALGGAFLLGNLAAYIRLRPAWRDAKRPRGDQATWPGAKSTTKPERDQAGSGRPKAATGPAVRDHDRSAGAKATTGRAGRDQAGSGRAKAAAGPKRAASTQVSARVREPTASGSKLPSRTRVLVNVLIGLVISAAALATLIRA